MGDKMENNRNFKLFINWKCIHNREVSKKILKGISDITYTYFLAASKQNPKRRTVVDEITGEIKDEYVQKYRYLYTDSFTKTSVAKELNISRPTLDRHIKELFSIGLIESELRWSSEKKKNVEVWLFPHIHAMDFIPADTADFFTHLCKYHSKYIKGDQYRHIIRLLFDLKRIDSEYADNSKFSISSLLRDIQISNTKENRLRILDYLILLQGLDIIRFNCNTVKRGNREQKDLTLEYFDDTFNSKMKMMLNELGEEESMNDFMEQEKFRTNFNIKNFCI